MDKIKEFLLKNDYEFYELDYQIEWTTDFLRCRVIKNEDGTYLVGNAIRCYFDRWANSGVEFKVNSQEEVIKYFNDKFECIPQALSELIDQIIEDCIDEKDDSKIDKMINYLYDLCK